MAFTFTSSKMGDIPFAGIRRVFDKAAKMEAQGKRVIHFEIGRPDFDTPQHIKDAAKSALDQGMVHYTPNAGIPGLRKALAASIKMFKNVEYDPLTEIMVAGGGQQAIFLTLQAILNQEDEVLIPDPGYPQFTSCVTLCGGTPIPLELLSKENFTPDLETAQKLVTSKTRAIIINSPHNPTGSVLTRDQIIDICRFAEKNDILILSDEAYDRMIYDRVFTSPAAIEGMKERTIIWGSLSKTYAMTGWRIGYIAAPADMIANAIKVQQNLMLSICSFAQAGAQKGLEGPQNMVDEMTAKFRERRQVILDSIAKIPGLSCPVIPEGGFYVFVAHDVPEMNSEQLAEYILDKTCVATVPGSCFGKKGEGYLRISYATSKADCQEGMNRIKNIMSALVTKST